MRSLAAMILIAAMPSIAAAQAGATGSPGQPGVASAGSPSPTYDEDRDRASLCDERLRSAQIASPTLRGMKPDEWLQKCISAAANK